MFGVAGVVTPQIIAVALLIGAIAFPGAFLARWIVERLPLHMHAAILDAVVIIGAPWVNGCGRANRSVTPSCLQMAAQLKP